MCKPKVSIIVPVYQNTTYLKACVNSLAKQTLKEIEIILVDDGSNNIAANFCDKLKASYNNVQVFHKKNGGVASARNLGIEKANGEFIAFVDADDFVEPEMYENLLKAAKKAKAEIALCRLARFTPKNTYEIEENFPLGVFQKEEIQTQLIFPLLGHNGNEKDYRSIHASACRGVYLRKLIQENQISFPNLAYSEDLYFNLKAFSCAQKMTTLSKAWYNYRDNLSSASHQFGEIRFKQIKEAFTEIQKLVNLLHIPKQEYKPRMAWWFMGQISAIVRLEELATQQKSKIFMANIRQDEIVLEALKNLKNAKPFKLGLFCWLFKRKQFRTLYWLIACINSMIK